MDIMNMRNNAISNSAQAILRTITTLTIMLAAIQ